MGFKRLGLWAGGFAWTRSVSIGILTAGSFHVAEDLYTLQQPTLQKRANALNLRRGASKRGLEHVPMPLSLGCMIMLRSLEPLEHQDLLGGWCRKNMAQLAHDQPRYVGKQPNNPTALPEEARTTQLYLKLNKRSA